VNPVDSLSFLLSQLRRSTHKPGKTETDQNPKHHSEMKKKVHLLKMAHPNCDERRAEVSRLISYGVAFTQVVK